MTSDEYQVAKRKHREDLLSISDRWLTYVDDMKRPTKADLEDLVDIALFLIDNFATEVKEVQGTTA